MAEAIWDLAALNRKLWAFPPVRQESLNHPGADPARKDDSAP
jgi:hypothetical protein